MNRIEAEREALVDTVTEFLWENDFPESLAREVAEVVVRVRELIT